MSDICKHDRLVACCPECANEWARAASTPPPAAPLTDEEIASYATWENTHPSGYAFNNATVARMLATISILKSERDALREALKDVAERDPMRVHGPGDPFVRISSHEHKAIRDFVRGVPALARLKQEGSK